MEEPPKDETVIDDRGPTTRPSDGGLGWMVTFSFFMNVVLLDGVVSTFGIFVPEFLNYFGESNGKTHMLHSILSGMIYLLAPIASVMVNRYGSRIVAIIGAILTSIGLFLSTFAPTLDVMFLFYSFFGGAGLGLMFLAGIVIISLYFNKHKSFATGIALSGAGVGGLVFAPLNQYFLETYRWHGTICIMSALLLNGVVFAAAYRQLVQKFDKNTGKMMSINPKVDGDCVVEVNSNTHCQRFCSSIKVMFDFTLLKSPTMLLFWVSSFLCQLVKQHYEFVIRSALSVCWCICLFAIAQFGSDAEFKVLPQWNSMQKAPSTVFYSVASLYVSNMKYVNAGYYIPQNFLPIFASDVDLSADEGALLILFIGISNAATRVLVGYITDQPWGNSLLINNVALVVGGFITCFLPYFTTFNSFATFMCLRSILIAELLGVHRFTSSFGLVGLCLGLATIIGSPIAGALIDVIGDYSIAFYFGGVTLVVDGIVCFPLRRVSIWEQSKSYDLNGSTGYNYNLKQETNVQINNVKQIPSRIRPSIFTVTDNWYCSTGSLLSL